MFSVSERSHSFPLYRSFSLDSTDRFKTTLASSVLFMFVHPPRGQTGSLYLPCVRFGRSSTGPERTLE